MQTFLIIAIILLLSWYLISFKGVNKQKIAIIEEYSKLKVGAKVVIANGIYGEIVSLSKTTAHVIIDKSKNVIIKVDRVLVSSPVD